MMEDFPSGQRGGKVRRGTVAGVAVEVTRGASCSGGHRMVMSRLRAWSEWRVEGVRLVANPDIHITTEGVNERSEGRLFGLEVFSQFPPGASKPVDRAHAPTSDPAACGN